MQIIDLTKQYLTAYFHCLEAWSNEMQEAGNHKESWYNQIKHKGLGVKLAVDDNGQAAGMIQYVPVEDSIIAGKDLYFIYCIWVHGHKKGVGNHQKKGIGKMLLQSAEADAESRGANGIAAWGLSMPFWMKASWFKKQGYVVADKIGMRILLWKSFHKDGQPPKWIREKKKPGKVPGKFNVAVFKNGWCPAMNITFERARRAVIEVGDKVNFQDIDTLNRDVFN
jgi:GNAT superfamily N-acetyltransferase